MQSPARYVSGKAATVGYRPAGHIQQGTKLLPDPGEGGIGDLNEPVSSRLKRQSFHSDSCLPADCSRLRSRRPGLLLLLRAAGCY